MARTPSGRLVTIQEDQQAAMDVENDVSESGIIGDRFLVSRVDDMRRGYARPSP